MLKLVVPAGLLGLVLLAALAWLFLENEETRANRLFTAAVVLWDEAYSLRRPASSEAGSKVRSIRKLKSVA